ncbi:MAG: hypothetical protein ACRDTD_18775 [Pseudonocardiaceae bacterium]
MDPDGVVRLLEAILFDLPRLPGAACRGRFDLFDEVAREDPALRAERAAAALCLGCPARPACPQSPPA